MRNTIAMLLSMLVWIGCVPRAPLDEHVLDQDEEMPWPDPTDDAMSEDPTDPDPDPDPMDDPPVEDPPDPNALHFETDIKPIFEAHCTECHDEGRALNFTRLPLGPSGPAATVELIIAAVMGPMPPQPRDRMPMEDLERIILWRDQGLLP